VIGQRFVACDREQSFLMPPNREWLPPRHLAWFVIDAVAEMDLLDAADAMDAAAEGQLSLGFGSRPGSPVPDSNRRPLPYHGQRGR